MYRYIVFVVGAPILFGLQMVVLWPLEWWRIAALYVDALALAWTIELGLRSVQQSRKKKRAKLIDAMERAANQAARNVCVLIPKNPCEVCLDDDMRQVHGVRPATKRARLHYEIAVCDEHLATVMTGGDGEEVAEDEKVH